VLAEFGSAEAPVLPEAEEEFCVEFIVLGLDGDEAAVELWAPLLLISLEPPDVALGVEAAPVEAALVDDISALLAPDAAPAAVPAPAAPVLLAEGPELLLPAPQWSETIVTLLTWNAFAAPLPEVVLLGEAVEPLAVLGLAAAELLLLALVPAAPEAVLGCPVICT
jgi:hypothetical protein